MGSIGGGISVGIKKSPIQQNGHGDQPNGPPDPCAPRTAVTPKIVHSKVTDNPRHCYQ